MSDNFKSYSNEAPASNLVLIIGAGCTGLCLANGLKKASIPCVVFEQNAEAFGGKTDRFQGRDWNFGIHWSVPILQTLLPPELFAQLRDCQVDSSLPLPEDAVLDFYNGESGVKITHVDVGKWYRLKRSKLQSLLRQGIDVRYGKKLENVTYSEDGKIVTAHFADGTETKGIFLAGADGSRSETRQLLLGFEKAALARLPFGAAFVQSTYSPERALFLRQWHPLHIAAVHPKGLVSWWGVHDIPNQEDPENWVFYTYISFPYSIEEQENTKDWTNEMRLKQLKGLAKDFCDPWKSGYEWIPNNQLIWYHGMTQWDPTASDHQWDNHGGRITLAGDSAHPMTYQRGQGLNHSIADAANLTKAVVRFFNNGLEARKVAIAEYEREMIDRGGEEVRLCHQNTVMVHNWETFMESPILKQGLKFEK
ncbi:MAG: hypothetical protein M1834_005935 [Cirrosporium novae-zelandiae]|nr:MAG: hypothetical protein M1834_005935 [Cirrosporium novae-zelandiae]